MSMNLVEDAEIASSFMKSQPKTTKRSFYGSTAINRSSSSSSSSSLQSRLVLNGSSMYRNEENLGHWPQFLGQRSVMCTSSVPKGRLIQGERLSWEMESLSSKHPLLCRGSGFCGRLPTNLCQCVIPLIRARFIDIHLWSEESAMIASSLQLVPVMVEVFVFESLLNSNISQKDSELIVTLIQFLKHSTVRIEEMAEFPTSESGRPSPQPDNDIDSTEVKEEVSAEMLDVTKSMENALTSLPEAQQPTEMIMVDMRPYQKQALAWMMSREARKDDDARDSKGDCNSHDAIKLPFVGLVEGYSGSIDLTSDDATGGEEICDWSLVYSVYLPQRFKALEFSYPSKPVLFISHVDDVDDSIREFIPSNHCTPIYVNLFLRRFQLTKPGGSESFQGGILADQMGLGKTIMMIGLIMSDVRRIRDCLNKSDADLKQGSLKRFLGSGCADVRKKPRKLIISIDDDDEEDGNIAADVMDQDTIEPSVPNPDDCRYSASTLIVCPLTILAQWKREIQRCTAANSVVIAEYYGPARRLLSLQHADVVLTTYGTIVSDYRLMYSQTNSTLSELFSAYWHREAHMIKNDTTEAAKACCRLTAECRWAMTGTPLQNCLRDAYSLLLFLRHSPWCDFRLWTRYIDNSYMKNDVATAMERLKMIISPVMIRRTKDMMNKTGERIVILPSKTIFIEPVHLSQPERDFYVALNHKARVEFQEYVSAGLLRRSYAAILSLVLRLRQACDHPILTLGPRYNKQAKDDTDSDDITSCEVNDTDVDDDGLSDKKVTAEFMRELYDNYSRSCESSNSLASSLFISSIIDSFQTLSSSSECPICYSSESCSRIAMTPCSHRSCFNCMQEWVNCHQTCPICLRSVDIRQVVSFDDKKEYYRYSQPSMPSNSSSSSSKAKPKRRQLPGPAGWQMSSKIQRVMTELKVILDKDNDVKVIMFSQWTSMLNILENSLNHEDISFSRLDGTMNQKQRQDALQEFTSGPSKVFLVSLRTGGVGLNLVRASVVFLVDPWWNPAVEDQAIDRVHRIGQERPVVIKRFIVVNSVEEKMVELQDKKRQLADDVMSMPSNCNTPNKLTLDDLVELMA